MFTEVRYPNIEITIREEYPFDYDGEHDEIYSVENPDASRVLERVRNALRENGVCDEEIEEYTREATRRCYNHLMYTTMTWVRIRRGGPGDAPDEA